MNAVASKRHWAGKGWQITVGAAEMAVAQGGTTRTITSDQAARLEVLRRWLRWNLIEDGRSCLRLKGIKKPDVETLSGALRRLSLTSALSDALSWHAACATVIASSRAKQRWIATESIDALLRARPDPHICERVRATATESSLTPEELDALAFLEGDFEGLIATVNEQIMEAELSTRRSFFETIEKSPLTEEQARAVVCFDNRVQVLAAAGSGKTSVMVARAAYAVSRRFVRPERILLLAFNKAAAAELQERVETQFATAGIDSTGLRASTFHSFGLSLIGRATGEKPRLASWLDQGDDLGMVMRIVDDLRESSDEFRYRWDLYRLLLSNAPIDLEQDEPDGYDSATRTNGYRTFAGEVVKSHGERLVANFLYLNGINYAYERPYSVPLADATHSQYRPDFYYPDIDVWHEHWALDRDGEPPASFDGYAESMEWKRQVHASHRTTLVETTWAEVMFADGLTKLKDELTRLGLTFDWNPDRPINDKWARPTRHEDLARLVRTFMTHVKSNSWTASDLERRLTANESKLGGFRTRQFLAVYWPVHAEWERRLTEESAVDFEDMLVQAAGHLEAGDVDSPYELIMVDEFQDASRARARLVRGLVAQPGRFLLAVGDDWQAINRFAGADLSVMTDFETWFGRGHQLALTTTFRCTQTICDVARAFVSKNPNQFNKPIRSAHEDPGPPVEIIQSDDASDALRTYLNELSAEVAEAAENGGPPSVSVDVLGRYGFERSIVPSRSASNLRVTFRTIHGSKGLEADYVVVPGLTTGTYGFPSAIADDPVLALAMPTPEDFTHAEERRLLYVALTRARNKVVLITPSGRMSPFAVELVEDSNVRITGLDGDPLEVCPQCHKGTLVGRKSRYGLFLGCSTFPGPCDYTRSLKPGSEGRRVRK